MSIHKSKGLSSRSDRSQHRNEGRRTESLISTFASIPIPHYLEGEIAESPTKVRAPVMPANWRTVMRSFCDSGRSSSACSMWR